MNENSSHFKRVTARSSQQDFFKPVFFFKKLMALFCKNSVTGYFEAFNGLFNILCFFPGKIWFVKGDHNVFVLSKVFCCSYFFSFQQCIVTQQVPILNPSFVKAALTA